jgi:uncharacterized protein (TIGR00661 family)
MRIVYGVFGYGRGHATRSMAVLQALVQRHEVLVLAGGDAYETLRERFPVQKIPTLGYAYTRAGRLSKWLTVQRNASAVLDLLRCGPSLRDVCDTVRQFGAQAIISDAEPWTHQAALRLGVPRIGFDHFGVMVYCRPALPLVDRLSTLRDTLLYRLLIGWPERVIVSSFYDVPPRDPRVRTVATLLRDEVFAVRAVPREFLLVYLNKGDHQFTARIESTLRALDCDVIVYGTSRTGRHGNVTYKPIGTQSFLNDLAACRALISTAGNQLVGEGLYFGKPMLVMPEDCAEQRLNAAQLERLGMGMQTTPAEFTPELVRVFLAGLDRYCANIAGRARDGRADALALIEGYLDEFAQRESEAPMTVRDCGPGQTIGPRPAA